MTTPDWTRTIAAWRTAPAVAMTEAARPLRIRLIADTRLDCLRRLWLAGWRLADLIGPSAPTIDVQVTDQHAYFDGPERLVAILAEARALELLHPNPFPVLTLRRRHRP